jgi:chemotaxis protein histidine kinase CheA/CheY-like chemotaxis protein
MISPENSPPSWNNSTAFDEAEMLLQQELRAMFEVDTQQHLQTYFHLVQQLNSQSWSADIQHIYRAIHTIKGGAVTVEADAMLHAAIVLEDLLSDLRYLEQAPNLEDGQLSAMLLEAGDLLGSTIEITSSGEDAKSQVQPTVNRIKVLHQEVQERYLPENHELKQVHQEFAEQGFDLVVLDLEMAVAKIPDLGITSDLKNIATATLEQLTQIGKDLELATGWTDVLASWATLIDRDNGELWCAIAPEYLGVLKECAKNSGELNTSLTERLTAIHLAIDEFDTPAETLGELNSAANTLTENESPATKIQDLGEPSDLWLVDQSAIDNEPSTASQEQLTDALSSFFATDIPNDNFELEGSELMTFDALDESKASLSDREESFTIQEPNELGTVDIDSSDLSADLAPVISVEQRSETELLSAGLDNINIIDTEANLQDSQELALTEALEGNDIGDTLENFFPAQEENASFDLEDAELMTFDALNLSVSMSSPELAIAIEDEDKSQGEASADFDDIGEDWALGTADSIDNDDTGLLLADKELATNLSEFQSSEFDNAIALESSAELTDIGEDWTLGTADDIEDNDSGLLLTDNELETDLSSLPIIESHPSVKGKDEPHITDTEDSDDLSTVLDNFLEEKDFNLLAFEDADDTDFLELDDDLPNLNQFTPTVPQNTPVILPPQPLSTATVPTSPKPPEPVVEVKRNVQIPVPLERLDRSASQVVDSLLTARAVINLSRKLQSQLLQLNAISKESGQFVARLRQLQDDYALLRNLSNEQESTSNVSLERYRQGYTTINRLLENILRLTELGQEIETSTRQTFGSLDNLDRSILRLKDGIETSRLVPFRNLTTRARAILRDLTNRYGKPVQLVLKNEQVELDAGIVQQIEPALLHLLRNAYDHGLESIAERQAAGKPANSTITLSLHRRGNFYRLVLQDDGRGIDGAKIEAKARSGGFPLYQTRTNAELLAVLCQPGFSSRSEVSEVSGRGVGMDVVASQIASLGGKLYLDTNLGVGTTFTMEIPAPQLLVPCVLLQAGDRVVALPTEEIVETSLLSYLVVAPLEDENSLCSWQINSDNRVVQGFDLAAYWQQQQPSLPDTAICIRIRPTDTSSESLREIRFIANDLIGQEELLISPLPSPLIAPAGLLGVSLQPDGRLISVLDPIALTAAIQSSTNLGASTSNVDNSTPEVAKPSAPTILIVDDAALMRRRFEVSLNTYGFVTHTCADGLEAWNWLQTNGLPDLMITDVEMPNMDGFTLIDRCRQADINIPIVVVSSRLSEEWGKEARRLGASDYLNKGFSTSELIAKVTSLLGLVVS